MILHLGKGVNPSVEVENGIINSILANVQYQKTELTPEELNKYKTKLLDNGTDYGKWFQQIEKTSGFQGPREYLAQEILMGGDYDTAGAMKAGVKPAPYKHDKLESGEEAYHWPSKTPDGRWLKDPRAHESAWMEIFMEATGRDPHELGIKDKGEAEQYLQTNMGKLPNLKKLLEQQFKGGNKNG